MTRTENVVPRNCGKRQEEESGLLVEAVLDTILALPESILKQRHRLSPYWIVAKEYLVTVENRSSHWYVAEIESAVSK